MEAARKIAPRKIARLPDRGSGASAAELIHGATLLEGRRALVNGRYSGCQTLENRATRYLFALHFHVSLFAV
jgi:hypothetical protein